jgi:hypothetical protein
MKKLTTSVDARNRDLPEVYEPSSWVNYYAAPTGDFSIEIPEYVFYVGISTQTEGAWYSFGSSDVIALVPSDDIIDGSAPNYLVPNSRIIHKIIAETHFSINSGGPVVISYWGQ